MQTKVAVILLLLPSIVLPKPAKRSVRSSTCQSCHPTVEDRINVHLIPHSHDDVGWLKTVDQYYYGTQRHIQYAGVQFIISSSIEALQGHPDRRFVQVESAFFWKWWQHQEDAMKKVVQELVNNGQLEIINGAWSMNDEAASHYHSTVDQFTWGFRFLNESFGDCGRPKIGWQIDPFGHSREHASLMTQLGFQGLVIGRLDYRDKLKRKSEKNLDFIWQGSANLNNSNIFTTMFPDFYTSLKGFCFDVACSDENLNDDRTSDEYNVEQKVNSFAKTLDQFKNIYQTSNMLLPMGGDFQYQAAEFNFANMDKLIKGFEDHPKYHVFYSTPSCYIRAVNDEVTAKSLTLQKKTDDFFPYASEEHSFWTGYFTSRPTSKRFERQGNNILQVTKQLAAVSRVNGKDKEESLNDLRDAMGIMQHHDAITGTEKQAVANDYAKMLTKAIKKAEEPVGVMIGDLLKIDMNRDIDLKLSMCLLANVSICTNSKQERFLVTVYNPLSRSVNYYVRLPIDELYVYKITGPDGVEVYDTFDSISKFDHLKDGLQPSYKELVFAARDIPPLGIKVYYVEKIDQGITDEYQPLVDLVENDNFGTQFNGFSIEGSTGKLKAVTIKGVSQDVSQDFLYYIGNGGTLNGRVSGAYIFRPTKTSADQITQKPISVKFKKGKLVDEVHQIFSNEITQIIRVYKDEEDSFIEFDWLVGNLQTSGHDGIEIITRYQFNDVKNGDVFFTDSNGREQIKRVLNKRSDYEYDVSQEPVASNYYPVTSKIVIKDEGKNFEAAILNDRAQGGSSLAEGSVELMVHRRLLRDDGYGVGEALKEDQYGKGLFVRGQHWLTFGKIYSTSTSTRSAAAIERDLAHKKLLAPLVFLSDATETLNTLEKVQHLLNFKYSGLTKSLPENVQILTLEPWSDDTYILRLEHTLEKNEDAILSTTTIVDLENLFTTFDITDIGETTLGANQWLDDYQEEEKLIWNDEWPIPWTKLNENEPLKIELNPMQIRTFLIKVQKKC